VTFSNPDLKEVSSMHLLAERFVFSFLEVNDLGFVKEGVYYSRPI
jgi:hypothetical protein